MRYLLDISFVMSSMFCIFGHCCILTWGVMGCLFVLLVFVNFSITVAYISTESTPPCLMLSYLYFPCVAIFCFYCCCKIGV